MIKTNQEQRGRIPRHCRSMSGTEIHGANDLDGMAGILTDELTNRASAGLYVHMSAGLAVTRDFLHGCGPEMT